MQIFTIYREKSKMGKISLSRTSRISSCWTSEAVVLSAGWTKTARGRGRTDRECCGTEGDEELRKPGARNQ